MMFSITPKIFRYAKLLKQCRQGASKVNKPSLMRHLWGPALVALFFLFGSPGHGGEPTSKLVYPGKDGRLVYRADKLGNQIPDFSHAGYMGGGVSIPLIPRRATVGPGPGDDGARIQAAIDRVSALPLDSQGFRGAVELARGTYEIAGSLYIRHSGVILRGAGQGRNGSILRATGRTNRRLIIVQPQAKPSRHGELRNTRRRIADGFVPLGARSVTLDDASPFRRGDEIVVLRPSTAKWIAALSMDRIPPRRDGRAIVQWKPGAYDIRYHRLVTGVSGERLSFDAPVFQALDRRYGGGFVYKHDDQGFLRKVGIEQIRGISDYQGHTTDEDHAWTMIFMDFVIGGWVRNVTAIHFAHAAVRLGRSTKWITVMDSQFFDPVSRITGRRRYSFHLQGQLHLGLRLYARDGRHDFATGRQWSSGIVFLYCVSEQAQSVTEPHHRYSTGILYDNVTMSNGQADLLIALWNRGNKGSGHGWAAANSVIWNSTADGGIAVEKPPLAQNYCIGCRSDTMSASLDGRAKNLSPFFDPRNAHWEHWNAGPVRPISLYMAQLRDRLGARGLSTLKGLATPPPPLQ